MSSIHYLAVMGSAIAALVASAVWYIVFAKARAALSPAAAQSASRPRPAQMLLELARNIVLALVLCYLVALLARTSWLSALGLALILWIGFPVLLLSGSVMYEKVPPKLALIHAGDWLIKLVLIILLLNLWR